MTAVLMIVVAALAVPDVSTAARVTIAALPPGTRATWLWGDNPAAEVIDWAETNDVSEIFVYVSPSVLTNGDLVRLQDMQRRARILNIKLSALGGDSSWTTDHTAALAWQRTAVKTGIFASIHLDVEPYLSDGWTTDLQATEIGYLSLLDKMRAASTLPIEADVPFWFGDYQVSGANLADEVLKRVSAITVMSYRDTATGPNSIMEISQDWLARGATAGKRVRLGAETIPLPDCTYCTFHEEGASKLGEELAMLDEATRSAPAFGGIAVHRYGTWRNLPTS